MINISQKRAMVDLWTAARLVAALGLCGASMAMVPVTLAQWPEAELDRYARQLYWLFGIVGFLVGWRSLGTRIAAEGGSGIGLGLRAGLSVFLWCVSLIALSYVARQILREKLVGAEPTEALYLWGEKVVEIAAYAAHPQIVGIACFLAITVGVLTRNTHHRWR